MNWAIASLKPEAKCCCRANASGQCILPRPRTGFWEHQVRWSRTVRLCRPMSYLGLVFTHGLPWAMLAALVAPAKWIAIAYLLAYLVLRLAMAWTVGVWGVGDDVLRRKLWLVPLRDAIYFAVWLASFASNRITLGWRRVHHGEGPNGSGRLPQNRSEPNAERQRRVPFAPTQVCDATPAASRLTASRDSLLN